jgi:hypothetical protein
LLYSQRPSFVELSKHRQTLKFNLNFERNLADIPLHFSISNMLQVPQQGADRYK